MTVSTNLAAYLPDLAQRLRTHDTGWRESDLRTLADEFGWQWTDGPGGPELETGLPGASPARLRPVDRFSKEHATSGEEFVGLYVPLHTDCEHPVPADHAHAFRDVGRILKDALGPCSIMGAYGSPMPYYDTPPSWGSPFRRWRGPENSLELHPTERGPELLLMPTAPQENWHWRQGHGERHALGGFFCIRRDPANAGLSLPGGWRTDDWDVFQRALGEFLETLAAETRALDTEITMAVHGSIPDSGKPMLCNLSSAQTLEIGHYAWTTREVGDLGAATMRELGWIPVEDTAATHDHHDPVDFTTGAFAPGEADGRALARTVVGYLRAIGVPTPENLDLSDFAQELGDYYVEFYGLTLRQSH
jgi:hypothetical protein